MDYRWDLNNYLSMPYLITYGNKVVEVGYSFADLTGYKKNEVLDKEIQHICLDFLRLKVKIEDLHENQGRFFIFTKNLEAREVYIYVQERFWSKENVYLFIEKPSSRLEEKFPYVHQLCVDNVQSMAVFSAADFMLLKANGKFFDSLGSHYSKAENCIGCTMYDIFKGMEQEQMSAVWHDTVKTGKTSYINEYKYENVDGHVTVYWNFIITPIKEEGKIKYIITNAYDVTDRVAEREKIQEQLKIIDLKNNQLEAIMESVEDIIVVIDKDGYILKQSKFHKDLLNKEKYDFKDLYEVADFFCFDGEPLPIEETISYKVFTKGERVKNIKARKLKDGKELYSIVSGTPVCNSAGEVELAIFSAADVTELIEKEKLINEQKEQLQLLIENMSDALILVESNKKITMLNKAAENLFFEASGIEKYGDSLAHTKYFNENGKQLGKEDLPAIKVLRGEPVENVVLKIERPDKTMYASFNGTPVFDARGNIIHALLCVRDVSEKHKFEVELKQKTKLFETIIHNMSNGIFIYDKYGKLLMTNEEGRNLIQPAGSLNFVGDSYENTEYFYEDGTAVPVGESPTYRALRGETVEGERVIVRQPHREMIMEFKSLPIYDDNGSIEMVITYTHDITEMVETGKIMQQQKEMLEAILDNLQEILYVFDKKGNYVILNKMAREHYKTLFNVAEGSQSPIKYHNAEGKEIPFEETPAYMIKCGKTIKNVINYFKTEGQTYYFMTGGTPIFDEKGNFLYGVVSTRDMTDFIKNQQALKETHEQLMNAEFERNEALENAMKMKDEFLATITHEFKTPLTVINAALQAIESIYGSQISDNVRKHLQRIRINSYRQLRLVNNLLDMTKYKSGHIKTFNQDLDIVFLVRAITQSVHTYASHKKINIEFSSEMDSLVMSVDDEKIERILLNLLSNAIKFTPEKKSIYVSIMSRAKKVIISIRDEGVGIPKDKHTHIFERFGQVDSSFTRQAEGTGIGLSLVNSLVKALGGSISLKSEVGEGSTFTVTLPIRKSKKRARITEANLNQHDNRIMQSAAIEFSDIYFD